MDKKIILDKLKDFNPNSRVWIYQSDKILSNGEIDKIESYIKPFAKTWAHHGKELKAYSAVLYDLFIIFVVDENVAEVGGCGIDSSVHLVQKIGKEMNLEFFDRLSVSFFKKDEVVCLNKKCFTDLVHSSNFKEDTLVFDNQVKTIESLKNNWIIPFKESWHFDFFSKKESFNFSL